MKSRWLLQIVVVATLAAGVAHAGETRALRSGPNRFSISDASGETFDVIITVGVEPAGWKKIPQLWGVMGDDTGNRPGHVVFSIAAANGSDRLVVPASSYLDLFNPKFVEVISAVDGFAIIIQGSDGAESYRARIAFTRHGAISRRVELVSDPSIAFEETKYNYIAD